MNNIWQDFSLEKIITQAKDQNIDLTKQQIGILNHLLAGENIFISGAAGTGKSTFLKFLKEILQSDKNIITLAPTGISALNVGGQTIHSFFKLKPSVILPETISKRKKSKQYQKIDLLVIDEISMVRSDVFTAIDLLLRKSSLTPEKPFGGVQILLIGDLYQLTPIVTRNEHDVFKDYYPSPFFFDTKSYLEGGFKLTELSHIYRQSDQKFIELLNKIRIGSVNDNDIQILNKRHKNHFPLQDILDDQPIILTGHNQNADDINQNYLNQIKDEEMIFEGEIEGEFSLSEARLPVPYHLTLKRGAKIMMTKNDQMGRWVNGSIGQIVEMNDDAVYVQIKGKIYRAEPDKWDNIAYHFNEDENIWESKVIGSYKQFPIILAWAITIHKSQGQTLESCMISLQKGAFASGQVYVALSRCKSFDKLYLDYPLRRMDIRTNFEAKRILK